MQRSVYLQINQTHTFRTYKHNQCRRYSSGHPFPIVGNRTRPLPNAPRTMEVCYLLCNAYAPLQSPRPVPIRCTSPRKRKVLPCNGGCHTKSSGGNGAGIPFPLYSTYAESVHVRQTSSESIWPKAFRRHDIGNGTSIRPPPRLR